MPHRSLASVLAGKSFISLPPETSVGEAARLMAEAAQSAVLVTREGVLAGIFTERDATFRVLATDANPKTTTLAQVMTSEVLTMTADRPFGHALHLMFENGIRHVPVVDAQGIPQGLVTARDALDLEACEFGEELVRREEITAIL